MIVIPIKYGSLCIGTQRIILTLLKNSPADREHESYPDDLAKAYLHSGVNKENGSTSVKWRRRANEENISDVIETSSGKFRGLPPAAKSTTR